MTDKRTEKWNRQKWESETVKDFQKMVRYESADDSGIVKCVSCNAIGHWKNSDNRFDAGHLFSRRHANTKFDPLNCHPQCVTCNRHRQGNYRDYTIWFLDQFGREQFEELRMRSRVTRKAWSIPELMVMREEYRARWKAAEERFKELSV